MQYLASPLLERHVIIKNNHVIWGRLEEDLLKVIFKEFQVFEIGGMACFSLFQNPDLLELGLWGPRSIVPAETTKLLLKVVNGRGAVKGLRSEVSHCPKYCLQGSVGIFQK